MGVRFWALSYIYIYEISSLMVNIIKWQVKFNPVA